MATHSTNEEFGRNQLVGFNPYVNAQLGQIDSFGYTFNAPIDLNPPSNTYNYQAASTIGVVSLSPPSNPFAAFGSNFAFGPNFLWTLESSPTSPPTSSPTKQPTQSVSIFC